ncbi:Sin3 associated polypeptide p18 [Penicillium lividum]|nr:Sin3 associated polypeptide p18 [Penicillium lividum]
MAAPSREGPPPSINRQTTTPFHLKLFYRVSNFYPLSDYKIPSPPHQRGGPASGSNAMRAPSPPTAAPLPPHLEIYTWQSCTLRELSQLLTSALPSLLPDSPIGTRLCFRLIYPDARAAAIAGPDVRAGRYVTKELGSVVIGQRDTPYRLEEDAGDESGGRARPALRFQGGEADKALQDARFIVGDYIECAILPPHEDGSIAPPLRAGPGPPPMGMRAFGQNGSGRPGRGGRADRGGPPHVPMGDWRRGERLPEGGGRGGRRGWNPY